LKEYVRDITNMSFKLIIKLILSRPDNEKAK
jgi:hypothetical protein